MLGNTTKNPRKAAKYCQVHSLAIKEYKRKNKINVTE
jgi:hypothetical protein